MAHMAHTSVQNICINILYRSPDSSKKRRHYDISLKHKLWRFCWTCWAQQLRLQLLRITTFQFCHPSGLFSKNKKNWYKTNYWINICIEMELWCVNCVQQWTQKIRRVSLRSWSSTYFYPICVLEVSNILEQK